eukprot:GHVS01023537.1.p1 GENE.GHVS01023537.1~~GHVS01023537.1.p1  ORF type:complete len:929 (+),score=68.63 GHVS01023537.1:396-2789(+)
MVPTRWLQTVVISRGTQDYALQVIQVSHLPKVPSDKMKYTSKLINLDENNMAKDVVMFMTHSISTFWMRFDEERVGRAFKQSFVKYLLSTGGRVYDEKKTPSMRLMMLTDKVVAYDVTGKWIGGISDAIAHLGSDMAVVAFRVKGHAIDNIVTIRLKHDKGDVSEVVYSIHEGYTDDMQFSTTNEFGEFFSLSNRFQMGAGSIEVNYIYDGAKLTVYTEAGFQREKHGVSSTGLVAEVTLPTHSVKALVVSAGRNDYVFLKPKALPVDMSSRLTAVLNVAFNEFGLPHQFTTTMLYPAKHDMMLDETTARNMANVLIQGCSGYYVNALQVSFAQYLVRTSGRLDDENKTTTVRLLMFTDKVVAYDVTGKWIGGISDVTVHVASNLAVIVVRVKGHSIDHIVMIRLSHDKGQVSEVVHTIGSIGVIYNSVKPSTRDHHRLEICHPDDTQFGTTDEFRDFFAGKTTVQMGAGSIYVDYDKDRPTLTVWNGTDEELVTHDVSLPVLVADVQVSETESAKAVVVSAGGEDYVFLTSHDPTKASDEMAFTAKHVNLDELTASRVTGIIGGNVVDDSCSRANRSDISNHLYSRSGQFDANDSNCNLRLIMVKNKLMAYNMSEQWIGGISVIQHDKRYQFFEITGTVRGASTNGHSFEKPFYFSIFLPERRRNPTELKTAYYEDIANLLHCGLKKPTVQLGKYLESTSGVVKDKDGRGLRLYYAQIHKLYAWSVDDPSRWRGDLEESKEQNCGSQDGEQSRPTHHTQYNVKEDDGRRKRKIVISCTATATEGEEQVEVSWRMTE